MAYTTVDDPAQYFNTVLYTGDIVDGDGTYHDQAITGMGFQPNWLWHKGRSHARQHIWADSVRGTGGSPTQMLGLSPQDNGAETNSNTNGWVESLDSDGFTVTSGNDSSSRSNNAGANTNTYVAWGWKSETSFSNDASSTSVGTIDSSGSINTTAGISILTYTGTGSAGTIAHGLGSVPKMIITKDRNNSNALYVYHVGIGNTHGLRLSTDDANDDDNTLWNDTDPTSSVFSVGSNTGSNRGSNPIFALVFAEVKGYSKFGSYTGNATGGNEGPFIYTGFKPAWIMIKNASAGSTDWYIYDNKRGGPAATVYGNNNKFFLKANTGVAEANETFDMYSNGFKIRITNNFLNGDGNTLIYMAFAESPFVSSNKIPTTAR